MAAYCVFGVSNFFHASHNAQLFTHLWKHSLSLALEKMCSFASVHSPESNKVEMCLLSKIRKDTFIDLQEFVVSIIDKSSIADIADSCIVYHNSIEYKYT